MSEASIKHVPINGRKYALVRMSSFDAIHFNLRVAEILAKHGINQVESIFSMSTKIFGMLNREDHDELLFTLLKQSQVQIVDEKMSYLDSWDAVNTHFTADNIADIYLVALECLRMSILPVVEGLKKNIGLDTTVTMQGAIRQLLQGLLTTLTEKSEQN